MSWLVGHRLYVYIQGSSHCERTRAESLESAIGSWTLGSPASGSMSRTLAERGLCSSQGPATVPVDHIEHKTSYITDLCLFNELRLHFTQQGSAHPRLKTSCAALSVASCGLRSKVL